MKKINVLIIDQQKLFLEGLQVLLLQESTISNVETVTSTQHANILCSQKKFDVIIAEITSPMICCKVLLETIHRTKQNAKVIAMLSFTANNNIVQQLLTSNFDGIIMKNTDKLELLKAIETTLHGKIFLSKNVGNQMQTTLDKKPINEVSISKREKEVLQCIANEKSTKEIASFLFISYNTVETHRRNLMQKIGTKNMVGLVKYAIQKNII